MFVCQITLRVDVVPDKVVPDITKGTECKGSCKGAAALRRISAPVLPLVMLSSGLCSSGLLEEEADSDESDIPQFVSDSSADSDQDAD